MQKLTQAQKTALVIIACNEMGETLPKQYKTPSKQTLNALESKGLLTSEHSLSEQGIDWAKTNVNNYSQFKMRERALNKLETIKQVSISPTSRAITIDNIKISIYSEIFEQVEYYIDEHFVSTEKYLYDGSQVYTRKPSKSLNMSNIINLFYAYELSLTALKHLKAGDKILYTPGNDYRPMLTLEIDNGFEVVKSGEHDQAQVYTEILAIGTFETHRIEKMRDNLSRLLEIAQDLNEHEFDLGDDELFVTLA